MSAPTDVTSVDIIHGEFKFKLKPMRLRLDGSHWVNTLELYVENRRSKSKGEGWSFLPYTVLGHVRFIDGPGWVIYDQPGYAQHRKLSPNDQAKLTAWVLAQ